MGASAGRRLDSPRSSELVDDAVCVVEGHGGVGTETLPLEGRTEGAELVLLVLLLLRKLHEDLRTDGHGTVRQRDGERGRETGRWRDRRRME